MTRFALWLLAIAWMLAIAFVAGGNYYVHRHAQQPRQYPCPPECADCGHSWASSKPVCTPKKGPEHVE